MDPKFTRGEEGGPWSVHVPSEHGPYEEPGECSRCDIVQCVWKISALSHSDFKIL